MDFLSKSQLRIKEGFGFEWQYKRKNQIIKIKYISHNNFIYIYYGKSKPRVYTEKCGLEEKLKLNAGLRQKAAEMIEKSPEIIYCFLDYDIIMPKRCP